MMKLITNMSLSSDTSDFDSGSSGTDAPAALTAPDAHDALNASYGEDGDADAAVGLSSAQLGRGRRRMLDLVNRLHNTGVQIDIDLPQIAVIGNQSAGKSSLIEAISGITLPRASGTCTRCPTECRLSCAPGTWKCVVSIRTITDKNGQPLGHPHNEQFGDVIYDKKDVEQRISLAQRAILNPNVPKSRILAGEDDLEDDKTLTFSPNCVSLQISGPDVADLSFCDLPGLIRSTSGKDGSTNDIKLVEGLVESYIKRPSCIILLTVSCETDPQNQGALQLTKDFDPQGARTVGVLTKPDRISAGDDEDWIKFIKNEVHPLSNNWYCVKQPNSVELKNGITWSEARSRENEFFAMTSPWSDLEPMWQRYLRTTNLVERLSSILSDLISKRLPQIHSELEQSIQRTRMELQKLPQPPSQNPLSDISRLIYNFGVDLSRHLEGTPDVHGLLQRIRPAQEQFRRDIRKTAPHFIPYEKRYAGQRSFPAIEFLGHEEEKGWDEGDDTDEDSEDADGGTSCYCPICVRCRAKENIKVIYIEEVLSRARAARTRELPGNHPYIVQESFIREFTEQWEAPALRLCDAVYKTTVEYVMKLVEKAFGEFGQGLLERQTRLIVLEHLKKRLEATKTGIRWLLALELRPFTTNTHYLADYKDKFISYYKGCRDKDLNQELLKSLKNLGLQKETYSSSRVKVPHDSELSALNEVLAGLVRLGVTGVKAIDLVKLLPPDEMEPAVNIMAEVRAYFQVAYKRFADNVPLAIDHELVRGLERDILSTIYDSLRLHHPHDGLEICHEFAQESPQVAGRREELNKKLDRMRGASKELSLLG